MSETSEYDPKVDYSEKVYKPEHTLEEVKRNCPGLYKIAEEQARNSPWKWDTEKILEERKRAIRTPVRDTFEAIRGQEQTLPLLAENLAAIRGQPTPVRVPDREPETRVSMYRSDGDTVRDDKAVSPLKEHIEAIKDSIHHTRDGGQNLYAERQWAGQSQQGQDDHRQQRVKVVAEPQAEFTVGKGKNNETVESPGGY